MIQASDIETELLAFLRRDIFSPDTNLTPETDLVGAGFDSERALAGSGQHLRRVETAGNALGQAQAHQPRSGEHDGVVLAFIQLAQACVEVAAQRLDHQVGAQRRNLDHAAQARRAHRGALRQFGQ